MWYSSARDVGTVWTLQTQYRITKSEINMCVQTNSETCGSTARNAHDLERHVRTHNGLKPYPCTVCGKCFTQSGDVTKHARIHTGIKNKYACSQCNKSFDRPSFLERHKRTHKFKTKKPITIQIHHRF